MEAPLPRLLAKAARVAGHAAKKAEAKKLDKFKDELWMYKYSSKRRNAELRGFVKEAEKVQKEDWATGPRLMARRDIGATKLSYGSVSPRIAYNPVVPEKRRKKAWLAAGDRVVILSGRDKGKIDVVQEVLEDEQVVKLKDLNTVS